MQHNLIRKTFPFALAAISALAACSQEPETFNQAYDPQEKELANAAAVELPPMLKATHTYRCKDNSLIYVDFMTDDKTANFRSTKGGDITVLKAPEAGQPYVSEDGSKKLDGQGDVVTYNGMSCKTG